MSALSDVAARHKGMIRELHQLQPWRNRRILVFALIWTVAAWTAIHTSLLPPRLACYFLIGATIQGFGILMHEGVHGTMFRDKRCNRWVAFVCGLPSFLSVTAYRAGHLPHHRFERGTRDPDELENFSRNPRVIALLFCLMLAVGELFGFYRVGPANLFRAAPVERRAIVLEYALIVAVFVAAFAVIPLDAMLHAWILPALFARQLTNVRTLAEHVLTRHGDRFTATRTVVSNRFVSFFMCNLNYHIEHHLFPGVPWYHLPALHRLLEPELRRRGAQVYRSYTRFLLDLARFVIRAWGRSGPSLPLSLAP